MDKSLTTDMTLLERISGGDEISWGQFQEIYSPLIRLFGADWGLNAAECDELVQDVMVDFFKASRVFRYDRRRGSFRSYLRAVVRSCVLDLIRRRGGIAGDPTEQPPATVDCAFEEKWDAEWHNHLFGEALKVLRSESDEIAYRCFERYAVAGEAPEKVARSLGVSVNAVYVNKCRSWRGCGISCVNWIRCDFFAEVAMRHFEDFEIEHMLNSTGSFLLRWRCRRHLEHCENCRRRLKRLLDDREFVLRMRTQLRRFSVAAADSGTR